MALPKGTKSVLLLNIPSYGAGTHPWGDDAAVVGCVPPAHHVRRFAPPAVDDGRLEVLAMFGIVDAAMLHNPLSWRRLRGGGAQRLGPGAEVSFVFRDAAALEAAGPRAARKAAARPLLAAQSDGEAWSFDSIGETVIVSLAGRVGAPLGPAARGRGGVWPFARAELHPLSTQHGAAAVAQLAADDPRRGAEVEGTRREPYL